MKDELEWDDIPSEPYYPDRTRVKMREFFSQRNRRRWNRLQRDFGWLKNEMKKTGLNPEDARFIL